MQISANANDLLYGNVRSIMKRRKFLHNRKNAEKAYRNGDNK